jgi:hypothetical protein
MSVQEYLLREPARKLAKARGISEREAMQELKDKSDQLQRMTAIGVGISGGGTAPRGLPERSLGTSPRGMRGTINGVKGTGAPRSPVAEALDLPPKIEKPSTLPSKPAVRGIEKPAYEPVAENPPDKQVFDYRKRAFDAAKERETINNRPQEGGTTLADQSIRTQSIKNAIAEKKSKWDATESSMKELNKETPFLRQPSKLAEANFKKVKPETISDPNVPEPVKIRDVKKYNDRGEKVKQGIRKRKQE